MKSFCDYAEKAIARHNLTGYNNLAREIGINKASVSVLRSGKSLPSEDTMIKLAELAGLPKEEALIDLNLWRSKNNPELNKVWQRLSKMVNYLLILFVCIIFSANSSYASDLGLSNVSQEFNNIYIIRQYIVFFIRYVVLSYLLFYLLHGSALACFWHIKNDYTY